MWPFKRFEDTTGFIPNEEHDSDPRNLAYDEMMVFGAPEMPHEGNVLARTKEIFNQGRSSSCTLHSTAGCMHQTTGKLISPRYGYWKIKKDKKYPSSQLPYGAYMKDSVAVLVNEGVCDLELAPNGLYTSSEDKYLDLTPTDEMRVSARENAGGSYVYATRARGTKQIFDAVVKYMFEQKRPVKVGVRWYKEYNKARKTGIVPDEWPSGSWNGHDMAAVAWKMIGKEPYLGFLQSWGDKWGDKGMVWMPRNYSHLFTAIAYVPPIKVKDLKIKKDVAEIQEKRNLHKERANAWELRRWIDEVWFKDEGTPKIKTRHAVARGIAGREWYVLVKALSYFGWTMKDIKNYLTAHAEGKTDAPEYSYDLSQYKKK